MVALGHPASPPPKPPSPADPRIVRPEFTGSAREYFRIWIVNLFFTLITLGVYSAWAKVRKKRYFYGSTRLDGDSFDYFASPKTILKGRIVAVALFVAYAFAAELWPASIFGFWAAFLLALPWLVARSLACNARNSAWRGLRFDFTATKGQSARMYIGLPTASRARVRGLRHARGSVDNPQPAGIALINTPGTV